MNSKRTLLSGGADSKIIVYDVDQNGIFSKKAELKDYFSIEKISSFHNNTNFAVASTSDGMIKVWNINRKE
jgi:WD40 repeat protein